MESLIGYSSDDENMVDMNTNSNDQRDSRGRDRVELDNYDNIQMDMSEDSNSSRSNDSGSWHDQHETQERRYAAQRDGPAQRRDGESSGNKESARGCRTGSAERRPEERRGDSKQDITRTQLVEKKDDRLKPYATDHDDRRTEHRNNSNKRVECKQNTYLANRDQRRPDRDERKPYQDERKLDQDDRRLDRDDRRPDRDDRRLDRDDRKPEREERKPDRDARKPERDIKKSDREERKPDREDRRGERGVTNDEDDRKSREKRSVDRCKSREGDRDDRSGRMGSKDKQRSSSVERRKERRQRKERSRSPHRSKHGSNSPKLGGPSRGSPGGEKRNLSPRRDESKRNSSPRRDDSRRNSSPRRDDSKRSKRSPEGNRYRRSRERNFGGARSHYEKKPSKLSILERLGISLPSVADLAGAMTPQQLVQRSMALQVQQVKSTTGIELPSYYNPAAMNPARYAEQIQKRRLLWGNKTEPAAGGAKAVATAAPEAPPAAGANNWEGTTFRADQDGKMTAKFKRLMGIKEAESNSNAGSSGVKPGESNDIIKKQEELFSSMEMQYEVARVATHTHRGLGLGFGTFQYPR